MRHSAAAVRRPMFSASLPAAGSWPAAYCAATLIIWGVSPFLRRLLEWKTHYAAINPLAALPIVMLIPAIAMVFAGRERRIDKSLELVFLLWFVGFTYSLIIAILGGKIFGGVYTFVQFTLPVGFAYWIATRAENSDLWYRRISTTLIVLAFITGVYGVIQYTLLPPWDAAWMLAVQMDSNGPALPFAVRVFSMLNSPGTFAAFLTVSTIMFLPRLTLRSGLLLLPIFAGLGLTMVRAGWVVLPLAIVVFAFLTTRRKELLSGVAAFISIGLLAVALSTALGAVGIGGSLQNRLASLGNVSNDASATNRFGQIAEAFAVGIGDPEGAGLGSVGLGTRLNSAQQTASNIDSGYLSRFVEMGVPGSAAFAASLAFALTAAIRVWRVAVQAGDAKTQNLAALAITMQVALLAFNIFGDSDTGVEAIVAWVSLALVLRGPLRRPALR